MPRTPNLFFIYLAATLRWLLAYSLFTHWLLILQLLWEYSFRNTGVTLVSPGDYSFPILALPSIRSVSIRQWLVDYSCKNLERYSLNTWKLLLCYPSFTLQILVCFPSFTLWIFLWCPSDTNKVPARYSMSVHVDAEYQAGISWVAGGYFNSSARTAWEYLQSKSRTI